MTRRKLSHQLSSYLFLSLLGGFTLRTYVKVRTYTNFEGIGNNYEDVLDVIAKLPEIAALIYRCSFKDGVLQKDKSGKLAYSASFCRMLGYDDPAFDELMRLYLVIHSDHEGGNDSAHATHLIASTLSDPYMAYSSGLNALASPLHGLANQEVLSW